MNPRLQIVVKMALVFGLGFTNYVLAATNNSVTGISALKEADQATHINATPCPTQWGEIVDGLRCRVTFCGVYRDQEYVGGLTLVMKVEIQNTAESPRRLFMSVGSARSSDPTVPPFPGLPPYALIAIKYPQSWDGRPEKWGGAQSRMLAERIPVGEVVVTPGASKMIEYAGGLDEYTSGLALKGRPLRAMVGGHEMPHIRCWSGSIYSGEFFLKAKQEQEQK